MKYPSICLITNILVISIIFSSADDSSGPEAKEEYYKAIITFEDGEKPPGDPDNVAPLSADIIFTDADGNNVAVVEAGSLIKFDIKVKSDEKYKDGQILECEIYESTNPSGRKQLWHSCLKNKTIEDWVWDEKDQKLGTNFKVTKLPGSESDEFIIECSIIVCRKKCPEPPCITTASRRKRKRAAFRSLLMAKISLQILTFYRRFSPYR